MSQASGELIQEQIKQTVMQARLLLSTDVARLLPDFNVERTLQRLDDLLARIEKPLRLGIIGEFRSGKSSLVNALAQAQIALTDEIEATATLNRYYYSENEHAAITYSDNTSERMSIPEALQLLDKKRGDTEWLYSVRQVDIGYPIPFLREIELWDTPGLGGSDFNTQLAERFSQEVDAVIWVFDVNTLGRQDTGEVLTDIDARSKLTIGVINKSENLTVQEAKRARNFLREIYPHVNFIEILPFSALLAAYTSGLLEEEPLAFGDAVPSDGGREQLLQLLRQHVLQDPRRVAVQAVLADCVAILDEVEDELHVNFLYRQRQKARYEQALNTGKKIIAEHLQKLQSEMEHTVESRLRNHLVQVLHDEMERKRTELADGEVFTQVMQRVLDVEKIQRYLTMLLQEQEPRIRLVIQQLGMQCDRALDQLLTPVERLELQRYGEAPLPAPSPASTGAAQSSGWKAIDATATGVATLFAIAFHPPLWTIPLAWVAIRALLYGSTQNQTESGIFAERERQGRQTIDKMLRDQILPQAVSAIDNTLQSVQNDLIAELYKFWQHRLLGGRSVEQIETLCSNLLTTHQQFHQWVVRLSPLLTSAKSGRGIQRSGRVAAADKETTRTILEGILEEGRRLLWILDVNLDPQVVQWLENTYPSASLRILTVESHLNDTSALLFEQAVHALRQVRPGAVNMGILRDNHITIDRSAPPFSGSWLLTERGSYYFSIPLSEVLSRTQDFDFETVTSDTAPERRVTAETFEEWWFNRDKNLPMLPVFLGDQPADD